VRQKLRGGSDITVRGVPVGGQEPPDQSHAAVWNRSGPVSSWSGFINPSVPGSGIRLPLDCSPAPAPADSAPWPADRCHRESLRVHVVVECQFVWSFIAGLITSRRYHSYVGSSSQSSIKCMRSASERRPEASTIASIRFYTGAAEPY
jgi:hypothetical protein